MPAYTWTWAEPEPIGAGELAEGDFIVAVPAGPGVPALDVSSGIAAIAYDYAPWPPTRRDAPLEILSVIRTLSGQTVTVPAGHELTARRRVKTRRRTRREAA